MRYCLGESICSLLGEVPQMLKNKMLSHEIYVNICTCSTGRSVVAFLFVGKFLPDLIICQHGFFKVESEIQAECTQHLYPDIKHSGKRTYEQMSLRYRFEFPAVRCGVATAAAVRRTGPSGWPTSSQEKKPGQRGLASVDGETTGLRDS